MNRAWWMSLIMAGCASQQRQRDAASVIDAVLPVGAAADDGASVKALTGVLSYTAVRTDVMSLDAWLGDRIVLTTAEGPLQLVATDAVGTDQFQQLDGHAVSIQAVWSEGVAPDPNLPAPMNGDEPMRQGVGFRVLSIVDQGRAHR